MRDKFAYRQTPAENKLRRLLLILDRSTLTTQDIILHDPHCGGRKFDPHNRVVMGKQ